MQKPDFTLQPMIAKLQLHADLSAADQAAVLALPYVRRSFEAHTYIQREGDAPDRCALLLSGFAYRQKVTSEGSRQIVALHVPGDPLDLQNLFLDVSDHSVQALTYVDLAVISRQALQELSQSRLGVAHAMLVSMLVEASILREWVLNIGRRDARGRLAHLLCEFAVRLNAVGNGNRAYELPMTQEQLADALGLTSVHVNRTLKSLEADGLIRRNRRNIAFDHWERLRDVADFNQRYLHLRLPGAEERLSAESVV